MLTHYARYWKASSLALEPRLSSHWIASIAFLGSVVSLPVPTSCFPSLDPSSSHSSKSELVYNPSSPPLSSLIENTLPSVLSKESLAKALHSNSAPLVKHCVSLALSKCLNKFEEVRQSFQHVERVLEEDAEFGQWSHRRIEYEKEMKRRVPNFHAIVQFSWSGKGGLSIVDVMQIMG